MNLELLGGMEQFTATWEVMKATWLIDFSATLDHDFSVIDFTKTLVKSKTN